MKSSVFSPSQFFNKIKEMFFIPLLISSSTSYDINFFSNTVLKRMDANKMTYKCFQGDESIPLEKVADNFCDCCDCSDEFLNNSIITDNKCINNKITKSQQAVLRDNFKKYILKRKQLKQQNEKTIKNAQMQKTTLMEQYSELSQSLDSTETQLSNSKEQLKEWVYKTNGLRIPTEEDMRVRKEAFVYRESNSRSKLRREEESEEMEEGFSYKQKEDSDFQDRILRRENKWKQMIKDEYTALLEKAIQISKPKGSNFLSKLSDNSLPNSVQRYRDLKEKKQKLKSEVHILQQEINKVNEILMFDGTSIDSAYLSAYKELVSGPILQTKGTFRIFLFSEAFIFVPPVKQYEIGSFSSFNGTMRYTKGQRMNDDLSASLNAFVFCHEQRELLLATRQTPSRYTAWIGMPEACPNEYSEEEFQRYLAIIEPFYDKLVIESSEL